MVTHRGCPQTPGRRRGPIPAMCQCQGSPVSYHRALMVTHQGPMVLFRNRDNTLELGQIHRPPHVVAGPAQR